MLHVPPSLRRSTSPAAVLRSATMHGYHSASGEFNYYPTSAHKRIHGDGADGSSVLESPSVSLGLTHDSRAPASSAQGVTRSALSVESAGLSRSPSQPEPHRIVVVRRSASQPAPVVSVKAVDAMGGALPRSGAAPLLHRYRTSHVGPQRWRSPRSVSPPPPHAASTPLSALDGNTAMRATPNTRRSLLTTCKASRKALESESPASATTQSAAFASGKAVEEGTTASARASRTHSVPVARVCLSEPNHSSATAADTDGKDRTGTKRSEAVSRVADARRDAPLTTAMGEGPAWTTSASSGGHRATPGGAAEPCSATVSVDASLAGCPSSVAPSCPDTSCIHSEQSIREFILMQRELRRCYTAMEDYEAVIGQLRAECTDAWEALHQQQRQSMEKDEEAAAEMARLRQLQQSAAPPSAAGVREQSSTPENGHDSVATLAACLEGTCAEAVDELQRALHAEKAAHTETRRQLSMATTAVTQWKARAAELQLWRSQLCQAVDRSPPVASPNKTAVHCTPLQQSNASSPRPRCQPPSPSPHSADSLTHEPTVSQPRGSRDLSKPNGTSTSAAAEAVQGLDCAVSGDALQRDTDSTISSESSGKVSDTSCGHVANRRGGPSTEDAGQRSIDLGGIACSATPPTPRATSREGEGGVHEDASGDSPDGCFAHKANLLSFSAQSPSASLSEAARSSLSRHSSSPAATQAADAFRFPPPCFSRSLQSSATAALSAFPFPTAVRHTSSATASVGWAGERECKELLSALLDKERQLAVIAEERTKYKLLYEEVLSRAQ